MISVKMQQLGGRLASAVGGQPHIVDALMQTSCCIPPCLQNTLHTHTYRPAICKAVCCWAGEGHTLWTAAASGVRRRLVRSYACNHDEPHACSLQEGRVLKLPTHEFMYTPRMWCCRYAQTREAAKPRRTVRDEIEYRRRANELANNGKERKDLYTDNCGCAHVLWCYRLRTNRGEDVQHTMPTSHLSPAPTQRAMQAAERVVFVGCLLQQPAA
jgi:hypothetical protein